jgi:transposase
LYADKGFCSMPVLRHLLSLRLPAIIATPVRGKQGGTRALCQGRTSYATTHMMQTDCGWRNLPSRFPPWQTVYTQLVQWRKTGIWDKIWSALEQPQSTDELQL